jgi:hypothetical protein
MESYSACDREGNSGSGKLSGGDVMRVRRAFFRWSCSYLSPRMLNPMNLSFATARIVAGDMVMGELGFAS